jgi:hypothetical protein
LSFQEDKDGERRRKPSSDMTEDFPPRTKKRRAPVSEIGDALKTVYQRAIDEDIPPEMLDLLGKLG